MIQHLAPRYSEVVQGQIIGEQTAKVYMGLIGTQAESVTPKSSYP